MGSRVEMASEEGIGFFDAWWFFATPREQAGLRNARDRGAIESRTLLLQADLVKRLQGGDLIAIGIRIQADGDGAPQQIPAHLFNSNNQLVRRLFSRDDDHVVLSGRKWSRVTVHAADAIDPVPKEVVPAAITISDPAVEQHAKPKGGRPRIDEELRQAIVALYDEGKLHGLSRKEQEHRVRDRARADFPELFPKPSQPSRPKILEVLKAVLDGQKST